MLMHVPPCVEYTYMFGIDRKRPYTHTYKPAI